MKIRGTYLFVLISMCGLIATSLGILTNVAGLFFSPVAKDLGLGMGQMSLTLTICNLSYAVAGMIVPHILNPKTYKKLIVIGTLLIAGMTALLSTTQNIWMLYGCNMVRGFCGGIVGMVVATMTINNWFVEMNGLATSIVMATSGLTGMALSPVISAVIEGAGWRVGYLVTAGIVLLLNLPAMVLPISLTPETLGMLPLGGEAARKDKSSGADSSQAIDKSLLLMLLVFGAFSSFATVLPQFFPGIAESYSCGAAVGASMLSVCMGINTGGKILLGILVDRIGTRTSLIIYDALVLLSLAVLMFVRIPAALTAGAALFGLGYGICIVGGVMLTKELFGNENYGRVYPQISLAITLFNALGSVLIGSLYDMLGSYSGIILMVAAMMAVVMVIIVMAYRKKANQMKSI